jgi:phage gp29-like protein
LRVSAARRVIQTQHRVWVEAELNFGLRIGEIGWVRAAQKSKNKTMVIAGFVIGLVWLLSEGERRPKSDTNAT